MKPLYKITIPGTLPDLNTEINNAKKVAIVRQGTTTRRIPGLRYADFKKKWTDTVYWECRRKSAKGKDQITGLVFIFCHWYTKDNRKDADNVYFAQKYVLDGLVKAGIFHTDGRDQIGPILHDISTDKTKPRVEITVYPIEFFNQAIRPQIK